MATEWLLVAKARNDFADLFESLSDEQLAAPSLCEQWSTLDVAGHLVSLVELSIFQLAKGTAKNRGDSDRFLGDVAKDMSPRGAADLAASLRSNASKAMKPFSEASMVADTLVHTLDVTRALNLEDRLDAELLNVALDEGANEMAKSFKKQPMPTFTATDLDWNAGSGPEISGTAATLLLALYKRDVGSELTGDGVALLPS